jgi:hypothetical protein
LLAQFWDLTGWAAAQFASPALSPPTREVWLRASGERWKNICWKIGLSRPAAWQHWAVALCVIARRVAVI